MTEKRQLVSFLQFLYQTGHLGDDEYSLLQRSQADNNAQIALILQKGLIEDTTLNSLQQSFAQLSQIDIHSTDSRYAYLLPHTIAKTYMAFVFESTETELKVSFANPLNIEAIDVVAKALRRPFTTYLADQSVLLQRINLVYRDLESIVKQSTLVTANLSSMLEAFDDSLLETSYNDSHTAKLFNGLLDDAYNLNVSDIHIEANHLGLTIRYRLEGNLLKQISLPERLKDILLRHILIRSNGDISETQLPQDTAFTYTSHHVPVNVRVSVLYSVNGYSIVLRILKMSHFLSLREFIKSDAMLAQLLQFFQQSNGMLIITGPTSSGKTTLLYHIIQHLSAAGRLHKKIITIEDPVEIIMPEITQVQVKADIGLDFGDVIKVSLRQNPDVLMLGEMRDNVTAAMAARAAITGVMVLATLHTKNTIEAVLRLQDLGVSLPMISGTVRLIIATRLVRKLCSNCKQAYQPATEETDCIAAYLKMPLATNHAFFKPSGCEHCQNTGYSGLDGIYELFHFNSAIRDSLSRNDTISFNELAKNSLEGKRLGHQAIALWLNGLTAFEEVMKLLLDA